MEAAAGFEPTLKVLQTFAWPLGYTAHPEISSLSRKLLHKKEKSRSTRAAAVFIHSLQNLLWHTLAPPAE
jgi:hypothetical protein